MRTLICVLGVIRRMVILTRWRGLALILMEEVEMQAVLAILRKQESRAFRDVFRVLCTPLSVVTLTVAYQVVTR